MSIRFCNGLPFASWPSKDQEDWNNLVEFDDLFADTPATGWAPDTIAAFKAAYGYLLRFQQDHYPGLLKRDPAQRVTPEIVEEFVAFLRMWLRDTSVWTYLQRIEIVLRHLYPTHDFKWLAQRHRLIKQLAERLEPQIAPTPDLYLTGWDLVRRSASELSVPMLAGVAAERYRDGLMIMLLVEAPIRRRSLAKMSVESSVTWTGKNYRISIDVAPAI